jgi:hypothetical protein
MIVSPALHAWRPGRGTQSIDVLVKAWRNGLPHWVKDEIDAFPPSLLGRGYKALRHQQSRQSGPLVF